MSDPFNLYTDTELSRAQAPASVHRSWARSRSAGLRPTDAPDYDELPLVSPYRRDNPETRRLWQYTREEVEQLWGAFGGTDWIIMCVNPQGEIVHARSSPYMQDDTLKPIVPGRRLREQLVGTTAPSCVLHEQTEALVVGGAHYLKAFSNVFCLAVPLFDADGRIVGVLDITGLGKRDIPLLREHFQLAALSVQQRFFGALRYCHLLRISYDGRLFESPMAGLIAVEEDGRVRAVSLQARRLLGLPLSGALRFDMCLRDVFPLARTAQHRRFLVPAGRPQRVELQTGAHVWVQHVRPPLRRGAGEWEHAQQESADPNQESAVPVGSSLQENALYAIQQALMDHHGNVAAAARQLGISRTTLYAKLKQMEANN